MMHPSSRLIILYETPGLDPLTKEITWSVNQAVKKIGDPQNGRRQVRQRKCTPS
jgi:hypothetical protein